MSAVIQITDKKIVPEKIIPQFYRKYNGAIVVFIGTIRNLSNDGRNVKYLQILPREKAQEKLTNLAIETAQKWNLKTEDIYINRRTGNLAVGEVGLLIIIGSVHRQEAFAACQYIVDAIKQRDITQEKDVFI